MEFDVTNSGKRTPQWTLFLPAFGCKQMVKAINYFWNVSVRNPLPLLRF